MPNTNSPDRSDLPLPENVREWNRTDREYPLDKTIPWFLEEQARKTPSQLAVMTAGESLTYEQLNRQVNEVAQHLRELGVGPDTLVGVYLERSVEMVVALLGIVKAGAAYVPFDPEYPQDRLAFMIQDSQVKFILTQERLQSQIPAEQSVTIALDSDAWLHRRRSSTAPNPPITIQPDNLVYMIYTSGSTGKPKGVPNIHRGLVNRILWMQDAFLLGDGDRVLQKTPFSFDVSVWEFFWPLMTGATLVMAAPGGHKDTSYLIETIDRFRITTMHFVPSMLNLFLAAEGLGQHTSLQRVMCSGEALPLELTKRFFARLPKVELHNLYGPTEAAIDVTHWHCKPESTRNVVPIGFPIANTQMYILADDLSPTPVGEAGELHIGGIGLARGYWRREELTRERFIPDPFSKVPNARLYKTGDLARYLPDGAIEYLGRLDFQVKIRGFRIELGEIEAVLLKHASIREATVVATEDALAQKQLIAYLVSSKEEAPSTRELREWLSHELPDYMVPARFVFLDKMPLLPNGKVDRKALPKEQAQTQRPSMAQMFVAPKNALETAICHVWESALRINPVGTLDNFFELGGNSLLALQVAAELRKVAGQEVPVVKMFQYPTVAKLAANLAGPTKGTTSDVDRADERATRMRIGRFANNPDTDGVAVVGMVGRFPGAASLDELWANLCNGVESISRFSLDEIGPGIEDEVKNDPDYVPTRGIITDADKFDAQFFGISPLEAKLMDPQHRVFLELAWAALENAGHTPANFPGMIGVYAGVGDNHYFTNNVLCHPTLIKTVGRMIVGYGNEKDYIATRVSYALNLTGPAVSANTGCSTSLLAVDLAFKALVDFECDMAIAGGVDIFVPQKSGQLYQEGGTFTRDGHCRPFDASATGTMFCDGAGIVVLRRLEDALASGDQIYAVIRGSAKNNDGANKVSFLAPSVEGQAQVILMAQAQANVHPDTISYIEAHGTATPLGDPIEITALTKAFATKTDRKQFCHIGSIKGNIGHPTIASGVASFIKTSLALHHEKIPGTLHYKEPNPRIDFASSPFKVLAQTIDWPRSSSPRRAGISSFGFGGTNVHVILEEGPVRPPSGASRPEQLVLLSAKTPAALDRLRARFADHFKTASTPLADVAYTLQVGRVHHAQREFLVCQSASDAATLLGQSAGPRMGKRRTNRLDPDVVFMFPGQGSQYVNMGRTLYESEPAFQRAMDRCCDLLAPHLETDLRQVLYPAEERAQEAETALNNTYYTQPALFAVEYALSQFWIGLGIKPAATVGHSIGEFVSACLAGVFSLEDVVPLVALRGRLLSELPPGCMLSVGCPAPAIEQRLPADVQLAAANGPNLCVVAGPADAIESFRQKLEGEGLRAKVLRTSHAFHSKMMEPAVAPFVEAVRRVSRAAPSTPFVSTCTGEWITDELATSPEYWGRHLRMPVRFSDAIQRLLHEGERTYLEVGPRDVLTTLARQHAALEQRTRIVPSLGGSPEGGSEWTRVLTAMGELWLNGNSVDWQAFYEHEHRNRVPLPTYPFERDVHWVDPVAMSKADTAARADDKEPITLGAAEETQATPAGERPSVMGRLIAMLERVSGVDYPDDFDGSLSFAQLGLDSLFLTQLAFTIKEEFGVKLSMRQLLETYSNLQLLEQHLLASCPDLAKPRPQAEPAPAQSRSVQAKDGGTTAKAQDEVAVASRRSTVASPPTPGATDVDSLLKVQSEAIELLSRYLQQPTQDQESSKAVPPAALAPLREDDGVLSALAQGAPQRTIPTSGFQREIFQLSQADTAACSPAFNESVSIALQGPDFDPSAMRDALNALVNRHEVLRASVSADGTQLLVYPTATLHVPAVDLALSPETSRVENLAKLLRRSFDTPFDLTLGPILRAEIVRMSHDLHVVVLTSHLAVCDGWSLDVLVSELGALYSQRRSGTSASLPPPELYSDYVRDRELFAKSEEYRGIDQHWRRTLRGSPNARIPVEAKSPAARSYHGSRLDLTLEPQLVREVKKLAARTGCSLYTVLLGALNLLLHRLSGGKPQIIGMPSAEQNTLGKPGVVGNCLTYVPLVCPVEEGGRLEEYLLSLRTVLLEAIENSRYDFAELKAAYPPPDDPRRTPFIPVCLNMSPKMGNDKLDYGGHRVHYESNPRYFESFELFVNAVSGDNDSLVLQFQYSAALFTASDLRQWQGLLTAILRKMAEGVGETLATYMGVAPDPISPVDPDMAALAIVSEICRFQPTATKAAPLGSTQPGHPTQLLALESQTEAIRALVQRLTKEAAKEQRGAPTPGASQPAAANKTQLTGTGDVPLYFGEREELFGLCRMPNRPGASSKPGLGALFCYPLGHEYYRAHWAFRLLSNFLVQRGIPVFKFDYYGTGDSLGDMTDTSVDRWVRDVHDAATEFKARAGVGEVSLIGLRFGAAIAAAAVEAGLRAKDLILWDPVVNGAEYLAEIVRMQGDLVRTWTNQYPFPSEASLEITSDEIVGIRFPMQLRQQIAAATLLKRDFPMRSRVHAIVSEEKAIYQALAQDIARQGKAASFRVVPDDGVWEDVLYFERALLPSKIIEAIANILTTENRQ